MRMGNRAVLLVTMVAATMLAFSGVGLTQTTAPDPSQAGSSPKQTPTGKIPGQYIVVLKDEVSDPEKAQKEKAQKYDLKVKHTYKHALKGFSAKIPDSRVENLRNDPEVEYVEEDGVVEALASQTVPWGIKKIGADLSSTKAGDGGGSVPNVKAYIIDSGIYKEHGDLAVDQQKHQNFTGDGKNYDCSGHGTHVAGSVAAKDDANDVVGVAPGAALIGVKVLGCDGSGAYSNVIKGVDWATQDYTKGPDGTPGTADDKSVPSIANMSLGGGASQAVDDAVKRSADTGVFYSIAAGNDGKDACSRYSPARAGTHPGVMTVGATKESDEAYWWSNYGSCVDILAPGVSILSTAMGGGSTTKTGTSMAAPHVGGAGALYLSKNTSAKPAAVETQLKADRFSTGTKSRGGTAVQRLFIGPPAVY
jgi:subtilisin family serine protease